MVRKLWVDPPSGWRYGFPKLWDPEVNENCLEWLVAEGYPQKEIDKMGKHFYTRQWYDDENHL
jgi:hypothetical protein